ASQVDLILVDIPGMFDRPAVYGERGEDYADNHVRFAAFSRAVAELIKQRQTAGTPVDIVQLHDWPSALVATYLAEMKTAELKMPKTTLTIHNVAHQGVFPKEAFGDLGLSARAFGVDGIEFYGKVN